MKSAARLNNNVSARGLQLSNINGIINGKKTAMLLCYVLLAFPSLLMRYAEGTRNCTAPVVGTYRDCLCGVMHRDVETRCHDEQTYYQPILTQENLTCPFQCLNGGVLINNKLCSCGPSAHGLCCETPTPFCGSVHLTPTGEIKSEGFDLFTPPSYLPNENCIWQINTDEDRQIVLGLTDDSFDIEPGSLPQLCNRDYLEVHDGERESSPTLGIFCGNAVAMRSFKTLYSSGRQLFIRFSSNAKKEGKGFHLHYRTFLKGQTCGPRTTFSLPTGLIPSPYYPIKYRPDESCEYEIEVKPDHELQLRTSDMNVPSTDPLCREQVGDQIEIQMKTNLTKYQLVTTYCGTELYPTLTIRNASRVLIKFKSNSAREGRFLLQYEQVPV